MEGRCVEVMGRGGGVKDMLEEMRDSYVGVGTGLGMEEVLLEEVWGESSE